MPSDEEAIARLVSVLDKHFPRQREDQLRAEAMSIYLPIQIDNKAEYTQEWNDLMLGEIEKVERILANFRETEAALNQLHSHTASRIAQALAANGPLQPAPSNREDLLAILQSDLAKLRGKIEAAVAGLSAGDKFTKRKAGRKRKDVTTMVAWNAGTSFWHLAKKQPTVSTRWQDSSAYGPFLALISDIFLALEIDANAERCARKAAKSIKDEIHPLFGRFSPLDR